MVTVPVVTVRLEPDLRRRLDRLAKAQRRIRSYLAREAIRAYVDLNEWQMEEIRKGLEEDGRGEHASLEELQRVLTKYRRPKRARRAR